MFIEVTYAGEDVVIQRQVDVPIGSTVQHALVKSAILQELPDFKPDDGNIGIFSRKVKLDHVLENNDRIELYRPLTLTPNEIRLRRAERKK